MNINVDAIPEELKARAQWVGWRMEEIKGKWTKPPYSARTGGHASHANPHTWTTFTDAVSFAERHKLDGVGFVFTADDEYAGIDLDKCRDPETGVLTREAKIIVEHLDSYTEVSPNKTGLHIIVCGSVPSGLKRNGVEIYDRLRYFTVTGDVLGSARIEKRYAELSELYAAYLPPVAEPEPRIEPQHVDVDDAALLDKARQAKHGDRFTALFDIGDWSGYESQSQADLALCSDLAFWTDRDVTRMDALFRLSGLMRPKWDEKHFGDGRTYGAATMALSVAGMAEGYIPSERGTIIIEESEYEASRAVPPVAQDEDGEEAYTCPAGGFISAYVEYARMRTDAPPQAHELMAVGILSALAGPRPRLRIATHVKGWPLTIWTMYVVDSTVGRKSTVLNFAVDICEQVLGAGALIPWEGSPQGIIQKMQERDGRSVVFVRDEYSGLMQQMKSGGHMAGLEQMFIRAYDGGVIENIRTKKKTGKKDAEGYPIFEKDVDRVNNPYMVKLCASTRTALIERCTIDDVISGFLPRFIMVSGKATPRPMAAGDERLPKVYDGIVAWARAFYEKAMRIDDVDIEPAVMDMQWALEQAWLGTANDMARPDAGAPSLKRLSETVLKVAALIAIDGCRDGKPVVTPVEFGEAYRLGERWLMSTMGIIEDLGSTGFMRNMDAYREYIFTHPGVPRAELSRKFRSIRKREADELLETLIEREDIEVRELSKKGLGAPAKVYYAFGVAPRKEGKERKNGKA